MKKTHVDHRETDIMTFLLSMIKSWGLFPHHRATLTHTQPDQKHLYKVNAACNRIWFVWHLIRCQYRWVFVLFFLSYPQCSYAPNHMCGMRICWRQRWRWIDFATCENPMCRRHKRTQCNYLLVPSIIHLVSLSSTSAVAAPRFLFIF